MDLEFNLGSRAGSKVREPESPLRLLVVGAFSGDTTSNAFAARKPLRIDIDNFDTILQKLHPTLNVRLGNTDTELVFESLEDFHPDELYRRVVAFKEIEHHSADLFAPGADASADGTGESDAGTLERLLGASPPGASSSVSETKVAGIDLNAMIRDAIAPIVTSGDNSAAQELAQNLDAARGIAMRELLHSSRFQALEASWRGLHSLVFENSAAEGTLEVSVLDVDQAELAQDLHAQRQDLRGSHLYELLVTEAHGRFGGESYAAVICDYAFAATNEDIEMLAALGAIATHAGAPVIAGAQAAILGGRLNDDVKPEQWQQDDAAALAWHALRGCAQAAAIGLVLPRIIGRLPYGGRGETIEAFDFSELSTPPAHREFLWINGAFACAKLLIEAFAENAWSMEPGDVLDLSDLPAALYDTDEGPALKACAEVHLSHASAAHLLDQGLMALMSHRDANVVRLARFQSIASPASALSGPWQR